MSTGNNHHKWWGWGPEGRNYNMAERPKFWPWIMKTTGITNPEPTTPAVKRETITLPTPKRNEPFLQQLQSLLKPDQISLDEDDRLGHAFGRSYCDLVLVRSGIVRHPPDCVLFPQSHEDVEKIMQAAVAHNVGLVAFGGGTNIVGAVEVKDQTGRMVASVDLRRMNRLVKLDKDSNLAVMEAGMFGPQIERELGAMGYSLGHQPDSFEFCTLGGWIATRSAGTQSNVYGKIEDMVVSLRMVTPKGTIETKLVPACSSGPDINRLIVGSEGILGIITQATMRVHPVPEFDEYRLVIFPTFDDGYAALHECVQRDYIPTLARLSNEAESDLILNARPSKKLFNRVLETPIKMYLKWAGYHRPAIAIVGFEGATSKAKHLKKHAMAILKKHKGFDTGTSGGENWRHARYDVPYLRDFMMDYGLIMDSFETATVWSNVMTLYEKATTAVKQAFLDVTGSPGYVGMHLSHLYPTGACIYITLATKVKPGSSPDEVCAQYRAIKRITTTAIVDAGGTLSHHHAVGTEHQPWMVREHSPAALESLWAFKNHLDPAGLLNPGSLLPPMP